MAQRIRRYRSDRDLSHCGTFEGGTYRSRWYRGLNEGMEWLRLSLEGAENPLVRVYAGDTAAAQPVDGLAPALERAAADILLYGVRGKYLCFTVEPAQGLRGYELTFPGLSIDSLLPAVMQGDATLRKLLGVYQSLYMDVSRELSGFPARLDPLGPDPLPELCHWLGAGPWMVGDLPRGELAASAVELNRLRGTKKGVRLLAKVTTGFECQVVEHFRLFSQARSAKELDGCAQLYGPSRSGVTLLFPPEAPPEKIARFQSVLDDFIPFGIQCSVVRLEEAALLDGHAYLDENARTADPPPAELDGPDGGELVLE